MALGGNPQVIVEFIAKVDDLKKGFSEAESSAKSTSSRLKGLGKAALAAAGAAGLGALVYTLHAGIQEYTDAAKVTAQTNAVIKSTGGVAHVTAKHVDELAGSLLEKSGVDDEVIKSGENMLLTFKNIRNEAGKGNDIFDQATRATLDLSVAMGKDMQSSAVLVGKALNDPVKGLTALTRVGVTFTSAQKEMIKGMVKSGDTIGAQKIILQELNAEFGGSAQAAGRTLPGQLSILRENFNNLAGTMVQTVAPALEAVTKIMVENPGLAKAMTIGILALAAALVAMNVALAVTAVVTSPITGIILGVVAAAAALAAVAYVIYANWNSILKWLKANMVLVATIIGGPFGLAVAEVVKHWDEIKNAVMSAVNAVIKWLKDNWQLVLVGIIAGPWGLIAAEIWKHFNELFGAAWNMAMAIKDGLFKGLAGIGAAAWSIIDDVGQAIGNAFSTIFNWGWQLGAWIIQGAQQGIGGIAGAVWGVITGIGSAISSGLGAVWNWGWGLGHQLWTGIMAGLANIGSALINAVKAPINSVIKAWNSLRIGAFTINLPGPVPDVHFGGIDLPNLPYLAAGGIVTGPTLAMIGEAGPEMVLPLGGSNAPVQVHVYIGDVELRSMVRTEVVTANNRTAQTLLAGLAGA
jgi:hypothetical protein